MCPLQGRPIRLMAVAGAVELVLASDVVDEPSDIPDAVIGGLMPEGLGIDRTAPQFGRLNSGR
ncbi:hypothetical protein pipiens_009091, partial [Culex pipiens pipiens]